MAFIKKFTLKHRRNIGRANKGKHLNSNRGQVIYKDGQKFCPKCRLWKPLDEYDKRPDRPIGVRPKCKVCTKEHRHKDVVALKFTNYKSGAKGRGIDWRLSKDQFISFWQKPCHYCGNEVETIGLDRIDSDKCYKIGNVVPCCHTCNVMKLAIPREMFIQHCKKIVSHTQMKGF
jgi:hypothetical protein